MTRIRTVVFFAVFYILTALMFLPTPLVLLGSDGLVMAWCAAWVRLYALLLHGILGIRVRIIGVRATGPILYAAKHQSVFETLYLQMLLGAPLPVVKRELTAIPLWGKMLSRYGVIAIDRDGSAAALRQLVREAVRAKSVERPIIIYPEGTRVRPGETRPLRPGFFALYKALGVPVMSVAFDSGRVFPRSGHGWLRPGTVTIVLGETIPSGLARGEIEARVHAAINALEPGFGAAGNGEVV